MTQVDITATYLSPDLTPMAGRVTFTPRVPQAANGAFYLGPVVAYVQDDGTISTNLLASDSASLDPTGWTYSVREEILGRPARTYDILVSVSDAGPGIDLVQVAPATVSQGTYVLVPGPPGPTGPQGATGATGGVGPTGPAGPHDGSQNAYGYATTAACGVVPVRGFGFSLVNSASLGGTLWLAYFKAPNSNPVNRWDMLNGVAAAGPITLVRGGLYTVDGSGNLTLVASSPSDATLLSGTSQKFGKALSSTYNLVADQQYAFGFLAVGTLTNLTLMQVTGAAAVSHFLYDSPPRVAGAVTGQTDLPATITAGSVAASNILLWGELS